jgi:ribosomal protein S6--L-glutamate ligase
MRLAVLASPDSWYLADLRRAARDRHEVQGVAFDRLQARLGESGDCLVQAGDELLNRFDAVLVRTMPPGSLEQVVFRMDALGRLADAGVIVVNPPRAVETAVDKFLTSAKLHAAGLPTPPTWVSQTVEEAMAGFAQLGGDVVVKPVFGSEGRGLMRVEDVALAERVFKTLVQLNAVIYLQPFIRHPGHDLRLLVIGDELLGMRRRSGSDWRTNLSRGAVAEPLVPDQTLRDLARAAAAAVGAPIAGVDVLPDERGGLHVLEVNAVPGWQGISRALGTDVASLVLDYVASQLSARQTRGQVVDRGLRGE